MRLQEVHYYAGDNQEDDVGVEGGWQRECGHVYAPVPIQKINSCAYRKMSWSQMYVSISFAFRYHTVT